MKQQDVTFKSEVTTTVIQEPTVFVSQTEQRQVTTPVSVVSEKVRSLWTSWRRQRRHRINVALPVLQEFLISAFEGKVIQEIELRIMSITYRELVTEDRELMVTAAEGEAEQPAFDTPVKNYRIMEGMGVTFHCKMSGRPLPKVELLREQLGKNQLQLRLNRKDRRTELGVQMSSTRSLGSKTASASAPVTGTRWGLCQMGGPASAWLRFCRKTRVCTRPLPLMSRATLSALGSSTWSRLAFSCLRDTHPSQQCRGSGEDHGSTRENIL